MHGCAHAVWLVHEQVAAAALDVGLFKEAAPLIRALAKQFPDSMRMKRLKVRFALPFRYKIVLLSVAGRAHRIRRQCDVRTAAVHVMCLTNMCRL